MSQILIVDDAPHMREVVKFSLEDLNEQILEAQDGKEGFELAMKNKLDLVITDLNMPVMNGMELLRKLKGIDPESPAVFILSAYCEVSMDEVFDRGAERVFNKPFSPEELLNECKSYLKKEGFPLNDLSEVSLETFTGTYKELTTKDSSHDEGLYVVLGRNGVFIPYEQPLHFKRGKLLNFNLSFADKTKDLNFLGCVEWTRPPGREDLYGGIGVRFIDLSEDRLQALKERTKKDGIIATIPLGRNVRSVTSS